MALDEAIKHCFEVSEKLKCENEACAIEHLQLAQWLIELKNYRENDTENE